MRRPAPSAFLAAASRRSRSLAVLAVLTLALAGCTSAGGDGQKAGSSPAHSAVSASNSTRASVPAASRPADRRPATSERPSSRTLDATASHSDGTPDDQPAEPLTIPSTSRAGAQPGASGGATVVLNPGHNGANASHPNEINRQVPAGYGNYKACDTTGTNTDAGYPEHAFNWNVAKRVRRILSEHGIRVIMTRPNDHGVGPCVDERAAIGNKPDVAAVVSIHADGGPASGHGFHVNQDARVPDGATRAVARASKRLGEAIHDALVRPTASGSPASGLVPSTYIGTNGYYYRTDFAGLNLATRPTTFLELGNMRNAGDAALQSSPAGRERIAEAVAAGILNYLGR